MKDKIKAAKDALRAGKTIYLMEINVSWKNEVYYIDVYEDLNFYYVDYKDGSEMKSYCKDAIELEDLGIQLVMGITGKPTNNFGIKWKFEILKEEDYE